MKIEFLVAKKYFFPKSKDFFRRISLISITTVFLSVFLPMLILGILNGYHSSILSKIVSKDFHIQVVDNFDSFFDYKDVVNHVEKNFPGTQGFPYFEGAAILKKNLKNASALLRGVPNGIQKYFKDIRVIDGQWKLQGNSNSILLASGIAKKLGAKSGDIIKIYIRPYRKKNSNNNEIGLRVKRLKVSGIFHTGYDEIDNNLVFIPFKKAQLFFNYGKRAWAVGFFTPFPEKVPEIKREIRKLSISLTMRDWQQLNSHMVYSFQWEKKIFLVVLGIIILATLFCVYIAFNVVVSDRKKEIGILKMSGMTSGNIQTIFFFKGLLIAFIAISLGTLCSFFFLTHLKTLIGWIEDSFRLFWPNFSIISQSSSYSGSFSFHWGFWDIIIIFMLNLVSILIATYHPVKRINQYTISESVRNV